MPKRKIKILFVDDEPAACMLFKKIVEKEGYKIFTAINAESGLAIYKKESPKIVFLDVVMPDTNGIMLLRKIRNINPEQIVIMVTGYGDLRSARAAMRLGAYDYISKPLNMEAIKTSIKEVLAQTSA